MYPFHWLFNYSWALYWPLVVWMYFLFTAASKPEMRISFLSIQRFEINVSPSSHKSLQYALKTFYFCHFTTCLLVISLHHPPSWPSAWVEPWHIEQRRISWMLNYIIRSRFLPASHVSSAWLRCNLSISTCSLHQSWAINHQTNLEHCPLKRRQ